MSRGGASGHDVLGANDGGFFGIGWPSFGTATELLFSHIGLLTLAPVCALGAVGWLLLWRRGLRAEALLALGLAAAFVAYNSGYFDAFGGFTPGPRFLIPILPFLGVGLAPAFRRLPLTTLALGLGSILTMVGVTITAPLLAYDGRWFERIANGDFLGHGFLQVFPLVVLAAAACSLAVRTTPFRLEPGEIPTAAAAACGWLAFALVGRRIVGDLDLGRLWTALVVVALAAAVPLLAAAVDHRRVAHLARLTRERVA